jgi:hypothetical protein
MLIRKRFRSVVRRGNCTFSTNGKNGGERDATASLDDLVSLIDPGSNDPLKRRNLWANGLTTLYTATSQCDTFLPREGISSWLTCPPVFNPALKHAPSLATKIVCARPVAAETNLTPAEHPRSSGRIFIGPSSQTALMPCRPSADDEARPQRWATP